MVPRPRWVHLRFGLAVAEGSQSHSPPIIRTGFHLCSGQLWFPLAERAPGWRAALGANPSPLLAVLGLSGASLCPRSGRRPRLRDGLRTPALGFIENVDQRRLRPGGLVLVFGAPVGFAAIGALGTEPLLRAVSTRFLLRRLGGWLGRGRVLARGSFVWQQSIAFSGLVLASAPLCSKST